MGPSAALVEDAGCLGHIRQQEGVGSREGFLKQGLSLNKERWGKAEGKEINGFGKLRGSGQMLEGQKIVQLFPLARLSSLHSGRLCHL